MLIIYIYMFSARALMFVWHKKDAVHLNKMLCLLFHHTKVKVRSENMKLAQKNN